MASFKGKTDIEWRVDLDAPTIEEIKQDHGVNLVSLESDPLGPMRNDPMLLVTVISTLCREQIDQRKMTPVQFAKQLPTPPDSMLEALQGAVIGFFPSGRASHVREVLEKFGLMNEKTDQLATAKMQQILDNPQVMKSLNAKADEVISDAIKKMTDRSPGT